MATSSLKIEPINRSRIPRIKFYDNPTLKGKPVVEIRDDGLYDQDKKICSIYTYKWSIPKEVIKSYKNKSDLTAESYFSVKMDKSLNKYLNEDGITIGFAKDAPRCYNNYRNPSIKQVPRIKISTHKGYSSPGQRVYLIYAEEYNNGVAKMSEYVDYNGKVVKLDKTYYFRPSDYGLFIVIPPQIKDKN